ncbi:unnamed protein product, partial [Phaeothamnion confervicola]
EDDGWGDDDAADDLQEGAFAEDGIVKRALKAWQKTPLITRNYMRATAGLTVFSFLFLNNEWPDCLLLKWRSTFTRLQLWRPVAPFLYYGPLGVSYVVTLHFVWTYMSELERRLYNAPQDFLVMVLFGATSLLLVSTLVKLDSRLLGHSLSCFLVYVWSRQNEGMEVSEGKGSGLKETLKGVSKFLICHWNESDKTGGELAPFTLSCFITAFFSSACQKMPENPRSATFFRSSCPKSQCKKS